MSAAERHLEGSVIAGNFRVERQLGRGAMGEVYQAEQMSLGKKIAIKVLHRHLQNDEGLARRFQREAKAASSLNHPNSLQIIDFGQAQDGELFIAMELLQGPDLGRVLQEVFPLPLERVVRIMGQVLSALDEAHSLGIIHRDLKPENIMVVARRGERDFVKVCDFGIAKIQDPKTDGASSGTITMAGVVCGTPEYMSPEQCRGDKLDGRADLYSAGVILYQMATGALPFTAETALGIVTKHLTEAPMPPRQRRPDLGIDPGLEALILCSMAKDRTQRPATASEMKERLEGLLQGRSVAASRPPAGAGSAVMGTGPTLAAFTSGSTVLGVAPSGAGLAAGGMASADDSTMTVHPSRARLVVPVAVVGLLVLGGAWFFTRSGTMHPALSLPAGTGTATATVAQPALPSPPPKPAAPIRVEPTQLGEPLAEQAPSALPAARPEAGAPARHAEKGRHDRKIVAAPRRQAASAAGGESAESPATGPKPPAEPPKPTGRPPEVAYKEGKALFDQGRTREAVTKYLDAVRLDGNYAAAYKALGQAYMRLGNTEEGKRYYKRYLELNPNDVFVRAIVEK